MDESYIHTNHTNKFLFYKKDERSNKSTSKGRRLILLHNISKFSPLCKIDVESRPPVDDLHWYDDTWYPTTDIRSLTTYKTLWIFSIWQVETIMIT